MKQEIDAINKNQTWDLVEHPTGKKSIRVKWIYKTKHNAQGEIEKHKACFVAKGYKQKQGIDYQDYFAPVARLETIRLILALSAQNDWNIFRMDVKSAFLNGFLQEDVYIDQPPGFVKKGEDNKVCRLKKALYGLKQAHECGTAALIVISKRMGSKNVHLNTLFTLEKARKVMS